MEGGDVEAESITCPQCGMTSHNKNDIEQRYCGNCHQYHDDMVSETEPGNTFRDGKIHVMREKCANCLLSPDRLVSGARAAEIVRSTKDDDGATFTCHRASMAGEDAICRGWYDKFAASDMVLRLAESMGVIEEVDDPLTEH